MKLIAGLVPRWLQRCPVQPFDNSLRYKFKMLPRSLWRPLIGPLDLNSKRCRKVSWEDKCKNSQSLGENAAFCGVIG